jgi:outer membrane lipoprotein carrier protein
VEEETVKQRSAFSVQRSAKETPGLRRVSPLWKRGAGVQLLRSIAMGSGVFLILFVFIFLLAASVHAAPVDDLVSDLQKKLSEIHDLKGAFSQTSYLKDLGKTETYSGAFYIKKPSGVMWEYKTPRDEKVIITGKDTWIYKKSQKQAIKTKFSKEAYNQVPIALLNGLENLRDDFEVSLLAQNTLGLKPKHSIGFVQGIILKVGSMNFPVEQLTIFDTYGNVITIELSHLKINSGLDDSLFTFTPPQGVEVFDMNQ